MSLRINNNIASLNGHRNLLNNNMSVQSSLEKLSSGLRINKAADDAAGLVISEQMRAQITGLNQAVDNSETAIAMVQTAEGALDEVNSLLNKARELVIHAANEGANDVAQLEADQDELDNVIRSITRISDVTQFGTKKLLDGSLNGATDLSANLTRVNVGNLANNTAVNTGSFSLAVSGVSYEAASIDGGTAVDSSDYVFTTGTISAMSDVATGASVNSGVTMTVSIDGTDYTASGGAGGATVTSLVADINSGLDAASANYTLSQTAGGGFTVTRDDINTTDITSGVASISFSRASGSSAGNVATSAATLSYLNGNESGVTIAQFNENNLSGLTTASTFNGSGEAQISVTTSGGSLVTGLAITGGTSIATLTNNILGEISGAGIDLDNATLSFSAAATGLSFTLTAGTGDAAQAVSFSLTLDNQNTLSEVDEVAVATGLMTDAFSSGVFNAENTGVVAATTFAASGSVSVTINGTNFTQAAAAGATLASAITGLQAQIDTAYGANTFTFDLFDANTAVTGVYTGLLDNTFDDVASGQSVFYLAREDNLGDTDLNFSVSIDSDAASGLSFSSTGTEAVTGVAADASFDLETVAQADVAGTTLVAGASAVTIGSTSTTTTTAGNTGITATLTSTANTGLSLTLSSSGTNVTPTASGGATLTLSSSTGNDGFQDIQIEVGGSAVTSASSSLSFTLNNGAQFHTGANAGQQVGVAIRDMDANEIGRNVADSGSLTSLNDLLSTEQSALTTGLTDEALRVIDGAIDDITNLRGDLGAFQANTLETGLNSLRISQENLTAAESTIRDVDFARESAAFTRNNILVQASTAMLAQANQLPQNVLQLLG